MIDIAVHTARSRTIAVVISVVEATRTSWREGLNRLGVSHVHECCSVREADSLLETFRLRGVLVLVDTTITDSTIVIPGPASPVDPSREDHLVILGPPDPAIALAAMTNGARAVLFPRHGSNVGRDDAKKTDYPGTGCRATGELGGYPVTAADGTASWLTWREVEVLRKVADGLNNKQIAELLGLSALTVKSHLARASRRLHTRDRGHLVLLGLRARVIT